MPAPDKNIHRLAFLIITCACIGTAWISYAVIHAVADLEGITDSRVNEVSIYMIGAVTLLWLVAVTKLVWGNREQSNSARPLEHQ
jgi:hypothetical protein